MGCRTWVSRLGLAAGLLCALWPAADAHAQTRDALRASSTTASTPPGRALVLTLTQKVPYSELPDDMRERLRMVLEQPTLSTRGPVEIFRGRPAVYQWLLNHPDRAVVMWRKLGAKCSDISSRGEGRFGWKDENGSDIVWSTALDTPTMRVWYAEGVVSPGTLWPSVPVRAVAVLRHGETIDPLGRTLMHHQADLYLQTDSKTAALVARVLGSTAPNVARQCAVQLEFFFSGLVWYFEKHPERAETMLTGNLPAGSRAAREVRQLLTEAGIREQQ